MGHWRDVGEGQVFKNWNFDFEVEEGGEVLYGLDFGFATDPTAMVKVQKRGKRLWVEELIYHQGLTNQDLAQLMEFNKVDMSAVIIADSADPKSIEELRRLGYRNIRGAVKGSDSVRAGIQKLRGYEVHVNPESTNLINEYYNYAYRSGTDQPIDAYNHLIDAFRYSLSHDTGNTPRYAVVGKPRKKLDEWEGINSYI